MRVSVCLRDIGGSENGKSKKCRNRYVVRDTGCCLLSIGPVECGGAGLSSSTWEMDQESNISLGYKSGSGG